MTDCECLKGCPFFNDKMPIESAIGAMYKKTYCLGENSKCARYMIFKKLGKMAVPSTLFPNQVDTAREILLKTF